MLLHILLSFALYALYVLLPIIPAVIIYKLFPKTTADVSGPLGGLTVKAGGAFAAYIVTVVLGSTLVSRIDDRIAAMSTPVWEVNAKLEFRDNQGRVISDPQEIVKDVKVMVHPSLEELIYPEFTMRLPLVKPDLWPTLVFQAPGFKPHPIHLKKDGVVKLNMLKGSVALDKIVLEQLPRSVEETAYTGAGEELTPADGAPSEMQ
jgi:hypothetical protein